MVEVKNEYIYYGGSDREFHQRDAYIQMDLSSLSGIDVSTITAISFNFCIKELNDATSSPASLKHLDVQSVAPTGDAAQKLGGSTEVANSATMSVGWNSIDVGSSIISDLGNGYDYAVFGFERFGSEMGHSRLLTFYSPSSTELVDGVSVVSLSEHNNNQRPRTRDVCSGFRRVGVGGIPQEKIEFHNNQTQEKPFGIPKGSSCFYDKINIFPTPLKNENFAA